MTTYSYAQLEQLWINAGGSTTTAPVAAAIALAESGGNPDAAYPGTTIAPGTGSTTDATGLWQILGLPAGNFTAAQLTDPAANAKMAVAKYQQAGNSFSPWTTYTGGAYTAFLQGGTAPSGGSSLGAGAGSGAGAGTGTGAGAGAGAGAGGSNVITTLSSDTPTWMNDLAKIPGIGAFSTLITELWDMINYPTRQLAFMIDRAFGMFKPGQGWRLVFSAVGVASIYYAVTEFRGGDDEGFTLALVLTAVAGMALFMGLRPWPTVSHQAIKPATYIYDIYKGQIPAAGPPAVNETEVDVIQATLDLILLVWVIQKIAQAVYDVAEAVNATKNTIFGWWGNLF